MNYMDDDKVNDDLKNFIFDKEYKWGTAKVKSKPDHSAFIDKLKADGNEVFSTIMATSAEEDTIFFGKKK